MVKLYLISTLNKAASSIQRGSGTHWRFVKLMDAAVYNDFGWVYQVRIIYTLFSVRYTYGYLSIPQSARLQYGKA